MDPYRNLDEPLIELELTAPDGSVEVIEVTPNHPFYVEGRGWTRVDELRIGDQIPDVYGGWLRVTGATWTQTVTTVYNFGVEVDHSYFVGVSGAWVHNCFDETRKYLRETDPSDMPRDQLRISGGRAAIGPKLSFSSPTRVIKNPEWTRLF